MIGRQLFNKAASKQVRFVRPVPIKDGDPLLSDVDRHVEQEIRLMVPPLLAHTPSPAALASCWVLTRETLFASGSADRIAKEAVAAGVSVANSCPYCLEMHTMGVHGLGTQSDAEAIAADCVDQVSDPALRQIVGWARVAHQRDQVIGRTPPFRPQDGPELIGVAVAFHYLTRMVNIFLPNYLLPPALKGRPRRQVKARIAKFMGPMLRRQFSPGTTLDLLPAATLPKDSSWAGPSAHVSQAIARTSAALDEAGARAVPQSARDLLLSQLDQWRGEEMGMSRAWVNPLVAQLPPADQAAGRVVLFTAFASFQLTQDDVDAFRAVRPDDASLVAATAWASFATARHIGSWHSQALRDAALRTAN
jgi:AhpD family alkylhydroperoxidase